MANTSTKTDRKSDLESQASYVADQAKSAAQAVGDKAKQAGEFVRDKADQGVSQMGKGMESLADTIRDRGPQSGMLGKATSGMADTLDTAGRYLDQQGVSGMVDDLTTVIKNHPLPAVLVGIGLGFMLARLTTSSRS
jgi:ElaB/YqjD/DUF883 family membrane-anchored ribosome-binding protein